MYDKYMYTKPKYLRIINLSKTMVNVIPQLKKNYRKMILHSLSSIYANQLVLIVEEKDFFTMHESSRNICSYIRN